MDDGRIHLTGAKANRHPFPSGRCGAGPLLAGVPEKVLGLAEAAAPVSEGAA